ncbi:hypothetical protein FNV43_RR04095 [Rhamnella rubrinervis]|uniref:Protein kinase domain-containing protein n=1 Tax=Rhamnella rubrinervis TaxID=2594499 RepID=A0A8K0HK22_9ROSA|nr:hypothetical protein FNV43_RR04095 [Rhamnella rubrinervis]
MNTRTQTHSLIIVSPPSKSSMKEPPLSCRKTTRPSNQPKNLKLVCSFNGTFLPRPPSGKLRYVGGETRIISVDRNIGFFKLRSKIAELCPNSTSFCLKFQVPESYPAHFDSDTSLVVIASDDDVRCMIDEYDKLELYGKHARLWLYMCSSDNVNEKDNGCGLDETVIGGNGFESEPQNREDYSVRAHQIDGKVVNSLGRYDDDSLRKIVLKQQMVAKQSALFHSTRGVPGLVSAETETEIPCCGESETQRYEHPLIDLGPEIHVPISRDEVIQSFEDLDMLHNKMVHFPSSRSNPLNPRDGNLRVEANSSTQCLTSNCGKVFCNGNGVSSWSVSALQGSKRLLCGCDAKQDLRNTISNLNRENVLPWVANCDSSKTYISSLSYINHLTGYVNPEKSMYNNNRVWGGFQSSIRNHRFGVNDIRNQRVCAYHAQNLRNMADMGNHRIGRLEGRISTEKYYPGLRPNTSNAKQGQSLRAFYPHSWRQRYCGPEYVLNGQANMMDYSNENLRDQKGSTLLPNRNSKVEDSYLAYAGAFRGVVSRNLSSRCGDIESSTPCIRTMDPRTDLLSAPNCEKCELSSQTLGGNFHGVPTSFDPIHCDLEKESSLMPPRKIVNVSTFSDDMTCSNGIGLGFIKKLPDAVVAINRLSNSISQDIEGVHNEVAPSVNSLLYKPSLSSSKEVKPPALSSGASTIISFDSSLKDQPKSVDLMDEGQFGADPGTDEANGVASIISSQNAEKMEKDNVQEEEVQQDPLSCLSIDKKTNCKGNHECSEVTGGIPDDRAAFYTHLGTGELQTIKTCDLEFIKELGSGTYGSVYHGKWKGSDVAVKKIKPSCFTEGSLKEDRLVADFWKEAHILSQLHHPNIVAFYGVVRDGSVVNLATVTEYMVNGSLKQVLRRKDRTIDRRKRIILAMDAAFGMEYLHGKGIVHFDLKSHNFLVNMRDPQRPICKIGDLGLSKIKQRTLVSGGVRGTIPWMAPELLNSKNNMVTEKVDVYSYGIVMWELLTGEEPYANKRSEEIIGGIIKGNLRPEIPSWCDPAWRSLMERCWSSDPDSRPPFSEIAKELRTMAAAMNIK